MRVSTARSFFASILFLTSMSAVAFAESPFGDSHLSMEGSKIPVTGKRVCATNVLTIPAAGLDAGVSLTFFLGAPKPVALTFSAEVFVASGSMFLTYSIDGGAPIVVGPTFFANDNPAAARTVMGMVMPPFVPVVLSTGMHTIKPFLKGPGALAQVRNRCFEVAP